MYQWELPYARARRETAPVEEEVLEFWRVERQPVPDPRFTMPVYPEMAKRAGLEGVVFVAFAVGADGSVRHCPCALTRTGDLQGGGDRGGIAVRIRACRSKRPDGRGEDVDAHPVSAERLSDTAALQVARGHGEEFHVFLVDRVGHDQPVLLDQRAGILVAVRLERAQETQWQ